jgi:hypothetical protein
LPRQHWQVKTSLYLFPEQIRPATTCEGWTIPHLKTAHEDVTLKVHVIHLRTGAMAFAS